MQDILSLHQVRVLANIISLAKSEPTPEICKAFKQASHSKQLWLIILEYDVVSEGLTIPYYCRSLGLLSSGQTESLALHILRLRQALLMDTEGRPPAMVTFNQTHSVTWVRLVLGQWVLVTCSNQVTSIICLWSLQPFYRSKGPPEIVAQASLEGPVVTGLFKVQDNQSIIVLELRAAFQTIIEILSLHISNDQRLIFVCLKRFKNDVSHVRCLRRPSIGFSLHQERSIASILDWRTREVVNLCRAPSSDVSVFAALIGKALMCCRAAPWQ
ncbi:uncharacterized protein PHACADRAFT_107131 [Phanerochaete carnosa HHB-10118-sp]|uniref:Uncharacterized protein n=1 Tax=Phanerochaete carnosa (strain HHB-10118-sp) TaxID=650164 RepID=K5VDQ2_PHACS|nr:uncharacterized protein PHACADRAFT_107131 [Phanerochaete carnosa HHB-10118-sp]EKM49258.1 hypothetical protein PHACADRAFT_107131 [Phanerochaete carnosa HHB-10118-sp]